MNDSPDPRPWAQRPKCCADRQTRIRVENLGVAFDGTPVLGDVQLKIHAGCVTALIGPSGCGKSTFLTCLNRLSDLTPGCRVSGRVWLDGHDVLDPTTNLPELRRRVGMIFQRPNPFPLSIRRNLTFPMKRHGVRDRAERTARMEGMLQQVGLWEEVKDRLQDSALGLSGGQQQRLCLARALLLDPEVLLLDEPTSALDPLAGGVIEDLIASLRGRYTTVIVTHNLAQARRLADDTAVFWLVDQVGTIVESGSAEHIFESPQHPITAAYIRGVRG